MRKCEITVRTDNRKRADREVHPAGLLFGFFVVVQSEGKRFALFIEKGKLFKIDYIVS